MNREQWNAAVASFPEPHLLQTWEWGQVKTRFGWEPIYRLWGDGERPRAMALVLRRRIPLRGMAARLGVIYVPKGPLLRDPADAGLRREVLDDLQRMARRLGAIFIKIDPDIPLGWGVPGQPEEQPAPEGENWRAELIRRGWRYSGEQIQYRNTVLIDLTASEEEMLARMKQKARYNIRYAARKGVTVRAGSPADFDLLYQMYAETSQRDGFIIREGGYYRTLWETFFGAGMLTPLIAEVEGEPVAGLMLFHFAGRAWYIHGMSRDRHRRLMPTYLLQWEAMQRAKALGCREYDLWGAPEVFDESDSMWGVYRFKRGLGGSVRRTIGAYDYPARPVLYKLYTQALPRVLRLMRKKYH